MAILNKKEIGVKINKLQTREKVTKVLLGELSREVLEYVYATSDIACANRLISVLTPINKKVAAKFFSTFLGWGFDKESNIFGSKQHKAVFTKKSYLTETLLADVNENIWTWADRELEEPALKAKNYGTKISVLVSKALADEKEGINLQEVLYAILASDEVSLADMMKSLQQVAGVNKAA